MTMPHLMNCSHTGEGWCLDCVKKLHDEKEVYENALLELQIEAGKKLLHGKDVWMEEEN